VPFYGGMALNTIRETYWVSFCVALPGLPHGTIRTHRFCAGLRCVVPERDSSPLPLCFTPALQEPKPGSRIWGSLQPLQLRVQTHR
jgi:hypothetical protein